MKKVLWNIWGAVGYPIVKIYCCITAVRIAVSDYVRHLEAWGITEDKEYYESNTEYYAEQMALKAEKELPKIWLDYFDKHYKHKGS